MIYSEVISLVIFYEIETALLVLNQVA